LTSAWLYAEADTPHGVNINWIQDPNAVAGGTQPLLQANYEGKKFCNKTTK